MKSVKPSEGNAQKLPKRGNCRPMVAGKACQGVAKRAWAIGMARVRRGAARARAVVRDMVRGLS